MAQNSARFIATSFATPHFATTCFATTSLVAACLLPLAAAAQAPGPSVFTRTGTYQGLAAPAGINEWLGIAYAQPPTGALRWYPPQALPTSTASLPATAFGSGCPQGLSQFGRPSTDENCLFLNVYAPANATLQPTSQPVAAPSNLPVMVWIHGGAFVTGEGSDYDPTALIQSGDVVVVTINYRLGVFGFLADAALAAGDPNASSGNYGLQDQQAAIAWVKQNIARFGGNPNNVTIFGESAGGASVEMQLTSPLLPAVHAAIIESGAYMQALPTLAQAEATGANTAMTTLGCAPGSNASVAACLRAIPAATIVNTPALSPLNLTVSPNVDNSTLTRQPLQAIASGHFQHVPIINGSNHDEYRLFVALNDLFGSGPVTPTSYFAGLDATFGASAFYVALTYPLANYPSPDYAEAALVTDYTFACGAHLLDSVLAQYTTVYSYELNDPNAPDLFLPPDPNFPSLGDSHAAELPYLWPELVDPLFHPTPAVFTAQQGYLAGTMRAYWTSLARNGHPLAPRAGVWQPYNTQGLVLSLVPPAPALESNFVAAHNCTFWKPVLLQAAGLPGTTPY